MEKPWKEFLIEKRRKYFRIGSVPCPAFGNELVYFNKQGFNHLIRKGRIPRIPEDARKRLGLFDRAETIIVSSDRFETHRHSPAKEVAGKVGIPPADFWSFHWKSDASSLIVVIRQIGSGPKHFFSIMKKYD